MRLAVRRQHVGVAAIGYTFGLNKQLRASGIQRIAHRAELQIQLAGNLSRFHRLVAQQIQHGKQHCLLVTRINLGLGRGFRPVFTCHQ